MNVSFLNSKSLESLKSDLNSAWEFSKKINGSGLLARSDGFVHYIDPENMNKFKLVLGTCDKSWSTNRAAFEIMNH